MKDIVDEVLSHSQQVPKPLNTEELINKWYENKIKTLYGAVKFNYVAMMMKEEFVHFHVIPRYDKKIERYGLVWEDVDYPKGTKLGKIEIDETVKQMIINDLK